MVFLDRDITFTVEDEAEARSYAEADPQFTVVEQTAFGEWQVTRKSGAQVRVPRRATLNRRIGGLFPTDFDPARWGIPASMLDSIDPIAVWNFGLGRGRFRVRRLQPRRAAARRPPGDRGLHAGHRLRRHALDA